MSNNGLKDDFIHIPKNSANLFAKKKVPKNFDMS